MEQIKTALRERVEVRILVLAAVAAVIIIPLIPASLWTSVGLKFVRYFGIPLIIAVLVGWISYSWKNFLITFGAVGGLFLLGHILSGNITLPDQAKEPAPWSSGGRVR